MAKSLADKLLDSIFDAEWTGRRGEKLTERELLLVRLFGRDGKILRNVYIPKPDGTTSEIDVLYLTAKGIFVIESKNYGGWIFGSEDQFKWTVVFKGGKKVQFYNPVKQNKNHMKWLRTYLGEGVPLFSVIVFSERCELKKVSVSPDSAKVIQRDRLYATVRSIWMSSQDVLSQAKVDDLYQRLLPLAGKTKEEKQKHIDEVESELLHEARRARRPDAGALETAGTEATTKVTAEAGATLGESVEARGSVPICPRCGAPMVLRTAKKGAHAGQQFYGCSNYPHCHGIVSAQ